MEEEQEQEDGWNVEGKGEEEDEGGTAWLRHTLYCIAPP